MFAACYHNNFNRSTYILLKVTFCFEYTTNQTTFNCGFLQPPADFSPMCDIKNSMRPSELKVIPQCGRTKLENVLDQSYL